MVLALTIGELVICLALQAIASAETSPSSPMTSPTAASSIVIGIVTSLVATFIFLGLAVLFNKLVLPWFRQQVYRGLSIEGTWQWSERRSQPDRHIIRFYFEQAADSLLGRHTLDISVAGDASLTEYRIWGFISDGHVVGYCRPLDKHSTTYAAFHLTVIEQIPGVQLKGSLVGTGVDGDLTKLDIILERVLV